MSHNCQSVTPKHRAEQAIVEALDDAYRWQPMATAPKDGTRILTTGLGGTVVAWWDTNGWRISNFGYLIQQPTHWLPIPPLPRDGSHHE